MRTVGKPGAVGALHHAHERLEGALTGLHCLLWKLRHRPHNASDRATDRAGNTLQRLLDHLHFLLAIRLVGWELRLGIGGVGFAVRICGRGVGCVLGDAGVADPT
jgi:hypothetical protein